VYAKQPSYLLNWLLFIGNDKEDEGQFQAPKKSHLGIAMDTKC
jgi:hypothetical protein